MDILSLVRPLVLSLFLLHIINYEPVSAAIISVS